VWGLMARRKKTTGDHPRDGSDEWSEPRIREACQELEQMWSPRKTEDKVRDSWFKAQEIVEAKAQDQNLPKENIERAIKKGSGGLEGANYEEVRYEGYGIGGAAVMVDCMTDNKHRTVADVRHTFTKYGGNLGTGGSVAFLFKHCGQMVFAPGTNEDKLMEAAIEAGAEDVVTNDDGSIEVITTPHEFSAVRSALEKTGFKPELAEVTMKPTIENVLTGDDAARMQRLLDALEAVEDVQEVYTTAVFDGG